MVNVITDAFATANPSVFTTREASIISKALGIIEDRCLRNGPVLYYFDDFQRYLVMRFAGLVNEQGHCLYLDYNCRLLAAETEFFGNQGSVTWDMRKIVSKAINLGAEHVVFAHNHPGGSSTPSDADVRHLVWAAGVLEHLNINLLDSYVVTHKGITSIKKYRLLLEEAKQRERMQEYERRDAERQAKRKANRAAKLAAKLEGAAA